MHIARQMQGGVRMTLPHLVATLHNKKTQRARRMQGGVRMTLSPFGRNAPQQKTQRAEENFVPNEKVAPQFADANEEATY